MDAAYCPASLNAIADFAEIGGFIEQPVKTYSSGMVMRLAFAVAINVDPEILLLSAAAAEDGQDALERLLELLPDIPAGKLAIAELRGASREDVRELERAGVDAVIVSSRDVGPLVGDTLPDV